METFDQLYQRACERKGGEAKLNALLSPVLSNQAVEGYLRAQGLLDVGAMSKKGLQQSQQAFNSLQRQSGLPYTHLSQIIAYSLGDNRV